MDTLIKHPSEEILYDIDCSGSLAEDEVILTTGVPVADPATGTTPLVFGATSVNTEDVSWPDGKEAAIGKVIQFKIEAGDDWVLYKISVPYTTNKSNDRVAVVYLQLQST